MAPPPPRYESYLPLAVLSLIGSQPPTPRPQPTATPTMPPLPTPSLPSTTSGMEDAGFESGPNSAWDEYSSSGAPIVHQGIDGYLPRSGSWMAWLGGLDNETSAITQTISVPATHPFLSAYALITSEEEECFYDLVTVVVNDNIVSNNGFCEKNNINSWKRGYIDLRAYAGQTITFSMKTKNDSSLLSSLFIDDLTFEFGNRATSPSPTPSPTPTSTPQPPAPTPTSTPTPAPAVLNPGFEFWR